MLTGKPFFSSRRNVLRIPFHVNITTDDTHAVTDFLKQNLNLVVHPPASVGNHD